MRRRLYSMILSNYFAASLEYRVSFDVGGATVHCSPCAPSCSDSPSPSLSLSPSSFPRFLFLSRRNRVYKIARFYVTDEFWTPSKGRYKT